MNVFRFLAGLVLLCLWSCRSQATPSLETELPKTSSPAPSSTLTIRPTPTITLTSFPSKTPTPTFTPTPTYTPTNTLAPTLLPPSANLEPMNHQWQSLNNCHRASIAILMAYYNVWFDQHEYDIAMDSLAEFLEPYHLLARVYALTYAEIPASEAVRWFLAQGIPVIMGQDLSRQDRTWHYRVVHGYSDQSQEFTIDDPLLGPGLYMSYDTFDNLSRGEGQIIPVYPLEMDTDIAATMKGWQMKWIQYP